MNKPITSNKFATDTWKMVQMLIEEAVLAEREECAKILDANAMACESPIMRSLLQSNAQAIRVRGQEPAVYSSFGLMGGDAFVSGDSLKRNIT